MNASPPRPDAAPPGERSRFRTEAARYAGLTAAYTVGALVFLWPLPLRFSTHIWGDRFDAWTTLWLIWHLADQLAAGTLTAVTDRILFPIGYNLWSFGHAALQAIGAGLVMIGVPLVTAYNLLLVGAIVTSALAAHAFGRALGRSDAAGVLAAVVFTTSPYLYGEGAAGCIELVAAGLLPLFGLTLVNLARAPGWRRALVAALVLASVGPFNWYYTLFAGMFGLAFAAWQAFDGRPRAAGWMLASFALAGALNAPLIPLVRRETPVRPPLGTALFTDPDAWDRQRELADGRLPLALLDVATLEEHDAMQVIQNSTRARAVLAARFVTNPLDSTPGALAWVLGVAGAVAAGRRGRGWLVIAAGATVLTLGPFLMIDDTPPLPQWSADMPLPYAWAYEHVPFFSKAYRPYRIGVIASLALAGAAAAGAGTLRLSMRQPAVGIGVTLLAVLGFTQPLWAGDRPAARPLADARIPPLYATLHDAEPGGLIVLPLQYQPLSIANARFQYAQVAHGHPTLNCNQLIRRTDLLAFRDYVGTNALLGTLLDLGRRESPLTWTDADLVALLEDGFRWVVMHPQIEAEAEHLAGDVGTADLLGQPAIGMLRDMFGAPALADAETWAFRLPATWEDQGRVWTWDGTDTLDIDTPYDVRRYGLSVRLRADDRLALWEGDGPATLSFWARPISGEQLVVLSGSGSNAKSVPTELVKDRWTWVEASGEGPFALSATGTVVVNVTRVQVQRERVPGEHAPRAEVASERRPEEPKPSDYARPGPRLEGTP
ncbi:MAG: hypothetical protein Q8P18_31145 [Pseudomonadota bacterium]|nr:hypothetical protein [Pseudomonadota bacterium]